MYAQFFGFRHEPFSIAPDPRYLFMSERHREALAHLLYGVKGGGGFVLLTGEIGAGKTTVCRCFLEQIPKRCNVAYIFNPKLTVPELLKTVCEEFRIPYTHEGPGAPTVKDYLDPLNEYLLKTHAVGQNNVLIIDEAQNLSADVLEQLRLLTNLETSERKLLQIILIGQPELRTMLEQPELEQLAQRVIARYHLDALSEAETTQYIRHRMAVAGLPRAKPFDREALARIHQLSRGVPRRINLLCDRVLLGAYALGQSRADVTIVEQAAREVFGSQAERPERTRRGGASPASSWRAWPAVGAGLVGGAALAGAVAWAMGGWSRPTAPPSATATAAPTPAAGSMTSSLSSLPLTLPATSPSPTLNLPPTPAAAPDSPKPDDATAVRRAAATVVASGFAAPQRSEQAAWRELAGLWRATLPEGDACAQAARQNLQCFRGGSGLGQLRQLDRPAVLLLQDGRDQPFYAVLTALSGSNATLRSGGASFTVPLATLNQAWRGQFVTLWRAPVGYTDKLQEGQSGSAVDRLAAQLAMHKGEPQPLTPQTFDAALRGKVQSFQSAHGLKPDGVAGPVTFMQLNRATGVDEPHLPQAAAS